MHFPSLQLVSTRTKKLLTDTRQKVPVNWHCETWMSSTLTTQPPVQITLTLSLYEDRVLSCKYSHLEYIVNIGMGIFSHVVLLVLSGS